MPIETPQIAPGLHLLSTPIGAARDITLRGLDALAAADALAAEDTRTLRKLMEIHGVSVRDRPLFAYHEHNASVSGPKILARLAAGESVVYASDAGTPLIADPGFRLARAARDAGAAVWSLPGPSAALAALVVSGLPTDAFAFIGFAPPKSGARRRLFESWAAAPGTLVIYETGRRLADCLGDLRAVLGDREAAIARELTKKFEEVRRGALSTLCEEVAAQPPPKGEIVLLVGRAAEAAEADVEAVDALLIDAMRDASPRDAARTVAERLGVSRKMVYDRAVRIKSERDDDSST